MENRVLLESISLSRIFLVIGGFEDLLRFRQEVVVRYFRYKGVELCLKGPLYHLGRSVRFSVSNGRFSPGILFRWAVKSRFGIIGVRIRVN